MADETLFQKLDELIGLVKAQLELTQRINQGDVTRRAYQFREEHEERARQAPEEVDDGDDTTVGNPFSTPTPAARHRRTVAFAPGERTYTDREKYSTPTGIRNVHPRPTLVRESTAGTAEDPLAEAWFRFNRVTDHETMVNHTGAHLDGAARKWWIAKLRVDRARQGKLFHDWHFFTQRLVEQYNPRNARMEAYNKLVTLKLTSDAPGAATRHVERFRDLEGQVNLEDTELVIDMFRGSLTRSLQEKFERNPPTDRWGWYREVEDIDRQRMLTQQSVARHGSSPAAARPVPAARPAVPATPPARQPMSLTPGAPYRPGNRPLPPHLAQRPKPGGPTTFGSDVCHWCKGSGHWAKDCPSRKPPPATPRPMGPRVSVALADGQTEDDGNEAVEPEHDEDLGYDAVDQEPLDLTQFAPTVETADDGQDYSTDNGKAVLELAGRVQDHPARILANTGAVVQVAIGEHRLGKLGVAVANMVDYDLILGFTELRRLKPTIQWDTGQLQFEAQGHGGGVLADNGKTRAGIAGSGRLDETCEKIVESVRLTDSQERIVASVGLPDSQPKTVEANSSDDSRPLTRLHGHKFMSAERLLQAAVEDGPIGFMLLEEPPTSLPAFGFVPTGADKGVEMEVELDKPVSDEEIPEPYRHLRAVFDEVEADRLPPHTDHDLRTELAKGSRPPQGPLYLKGPKEMAKLRKYLDENLAKRFIWPSKSPARSPVLFVPKKDGGLRLCVDYRGLNEITIKNRAPLPLIEEQLFLLRNAKIYSKLDLKAAYNLIRIASGDEWKTAFGTQLGLYEYLVMPFGLANAPAHFQSVINHIYRDIIGVYVVVYLDDFLIFSNTVDEHIQHVTEVLTRLKRHRLFAKPSKCAFHTDTVEFLGYIIKPSGIEMDPEKVRTVQEWPMPESIHDIQRFLGFANFYRRFIAHFARIAKPLTALVKPTERFKKFGLPEEAKQAFHRLIQAFTTAGVLRHFDYHLPTRLETDASDFAIAGVLKQEHEGRWHPVAYYLRKMAPAEKNYEIHDKELLAVVACLTQWRHMLAGLPSQLVILTDHEALKYFKSQRRITGRQARWAVLLADFDFVLQYRPGDKAGKPDALTRRRDMEPAGEEREHNVRQLLPNSAFTRDNDKDRQVYAIRRVSERKLGESAASNDRGPTMANVASAGLLGQCKTFQPLDQELAELHAKSPFETRDGVWYKDGQLVVPKVTMPGRTDSRKTRSAQEVDKNSLSVEHLRFMVMAQCHDGVTAGHVGRDATIHLARRHYWWPGMTAWIADYVASCPVCARYKAPQHRPYGLLQPLATPQRPWGSISLDFIEGLPTSDGYDSILVVVDRLTKYAIVAPTHKTATAEQTAHLLKIHLFGTFGTPDHIVSDRGRQFISKTWAEFISSIGARHSLSTAYHPQTDGQTERVNQVLEQYLRMYCNYEQNDWVKLLVTAAFVYNNAVHSSIGVSPFFACYGWNPKSHPEIPARLGVNNLKLAEFLVQGHERYKYLQDQIRHAQSRAVEQYNRKHKDLELKVGDMVYINRKNWKTRRPTAKLDTRFAGPYPVKERIGRRAYRITLPASLKVHDVFHISMLEPAKSSSLAQRSQLPVDPPLPDEELEYEVEAIVGKQVRNGQLEYKVLWRGYPEEAASWEPQALLSCPDLIREYEESVGGRA
ncbi:related to pol protein [Ustilago trichophora]|uniref:Related to pol protein n=1 Tax=Ustilago trichophora TaxID=86804 RepID=A0A5C3EIA6_9BASI|nr:related to pol protein [Ustilago trichophora]